VQFSQFHKLCDLHLGSGQGYINIRNTCRTTSLPKHMTVASHITEIWPFAYHEISTVGKVCTTVIAFLEGNSKIGLWQAVDQVRYYQHQPSVLIELHAKTAEKIHLEKCNFRNVGSSVFLTLTLDGSRSHWYTYLVEVHTHQIRPELEKLLVDIQTEGHTRVPIY